MSKTKGSSVLLATAALLLSLSGCSNPTDQPSTAGQQGQTPATADARPPRNPLRNAYFGDLHLHSGFSMDAFAMGTRTTPDDAFRYAMGETVDDLQATKALGSARLPRPHRSCRVSGSWAANGESQWRLR